VGILSIDRVFSAIYARAEYIVAGVAVPLYGSYDGDYLGYALPKMEVFSTRTKGSVSVRNFKLLAILLWRRSANEILST
jgi:hypothetical protein